MDVTELNARFGIGEQVEVTYGLSDLPHMVLRKGDSTVELALNGGQVLHYQKGKRALLWVSAAAVYVPGKPVRGGIPLCWPWFGPHPSDPQLPAHGFARNQLWEPVASNIIDGDAWVQLGLHDSRATQAIWPYRFALTLTVQLGDHLTVTLETHNRDTRPFVFGGALHSYFSVSDSAAIQIGGLEQTSYTDKVGGGEHMQAGPVQISGEVDRIYHDTTATCTIVDPATESPIVVAKHGSRSTVVWNPWIEKAARFSDMADTEYRNFVCVETALAGPDQISLAPGEQHRLQVRIGTDE